MRIRRLGWAGLELEAAGSTAVIDLLEELGPMAELFGEPHEPLPRPNAPGTVSLALVTHLHFDHADPPALGRALAPDGIVLRPAPADGRGLETVAMAAAERGFAQLEIPTRVVEPWGTVDVGPFEVTAVPAADGFGDPQVSWVVAAEGRRIIHCGDTVFHGWWWLTKLRHGPFDAAFLPVNGPIHYDTLNNPPTYAQVDRPAQAFAQAATRRGVRAHVVAPGEYLEQRASAGQAKETPARPTRRSL